MKKFLIFLLSFALIFSFMLPSFALGEEIVLRFNSDGSFKILHLTDTQDDAHPSPDMLNLLKMAIEYSDPDLIVYTGDLVEDTRYFDIASDDQPLKEGVNVENIKRELNVEKTRVNVEKAVDDVFSVFESYEIPYVIALGNNDRKVGLSTADWLDIFSAYPHMIAFDESPDEQDGLDYHVTIKGNDDSAKFNIWLMDSCRYGISDEQIDWYKAESKAETAANGGEVVPALAFQHIPAVDVGNLFEPCKATDFGARKGKDGWLKLKDGTKSGFNMFSYDPCDSSYEFKAWKECGDVVGAFFGHRHVEGYSGDVDGIELGLTYGMEMAKTGPYGFRTFTLSESEPADFATEQFRYTGKAALGTAKIEPESDFTGENAKPVNVLNAKILDFVYKIISFFEAIGR